MLPYKSSYEIISHCKQIIDQYEYNHYNPWQGKRLIDTDTRIQLNGR